MIIGCTTVEEMRLMVVEHDRDCTDPTHIKGCTVAGVVLCESAKRFDRPDGGGTQIVKCALPLLHGTDHLNGFFRWSTP